MSKEKIGRLLLEASTGMHGEEAKILSDAWCDMARKNEELQSRIAELEQRLEVRADGKHDGIYCRDQTIAAQDEIIDDLQKKVAELEKDAARMDWMEENYLCADFRYGDPATEVVVIEMPKRSHFCGNLRVDIDTAMQKD